MGFNATVVVCLDQLHEIDNDPKFGPAFSQAVLQCSGRNKAIYGPHGIVVVETHHADHLVPVIIGGNTGRVIPAYVGINPNEYDEATNIRILKDMARVLGYRVSKIPTKESAWDRMAKRQSKLLK
jgi:hypothetical protein